MDHESNLSGNTDPEELIPTDTYKRPIKLKKRKAKSATKFEPPTVEQILSFADSHFRRTGSWPIAEPTPVPEVPGKTWWYIDQRLRRLGLGPERSSLCRLLAAERGVVSRQHQPPLCFDQILAWADEHKARTGD